MEKNIWTWIRIDPKHFINAQILSYSSGFSPSSYYIYSIYMLLTTLSLKSRCINSELSGRAPIGMRGGAKCGQSAHRIYVVGAPFWKIPVFYGGSQKWRKKFERNKIILINVILYCIPVANSFPTVAIVLERQHIQRIYNVRLIRLKQLYSNDNTSRGYEQS